MRTRCFYIITDFLPTSPSIYLVKGGHAIVIEIPTVYLCLINISDFIMTALRSILLCLAGIMTAPGKCIMTVFFRSSEIFRELPSTPMWWLCSRERCMKMIVWASYTIYQPYRPSHDICSFIRNGPILNVRISPKTRYPRAEPFLTMGRWPEECFHQSFTLTKTSPISIVTL